MELVTIPAEDPGAELEPRGGGHAGRSHHLPPTPDQTLKHLTRKLEKKVSKSIKSLSTTFLNYFYKR